MFMNKVICRFLCDVTLAWYFCNYVWVLLLNLGHEYSFFLHLLDLGKQRQWEMQKRIMTSWTSGLREQTLELAICLADKKLWILVSRCSICRWLVLRVLSTPLLHYMEHQDVFLHWILIRMVGCGHFSLYCILYVLYLRFNCDTR